MDSLKYHLGPPCPSHLDPTGGPHLNWCYRRFSGGPPAGHFLDTPRLTPMPLSDKGCSFWSFISRIWPDF
jgi:hypothetical protein